MTNSTQIVSSLFRTTCSLGRQQNIMLIANQSPLTTNRAFSFNYTVKMDKTFLWWLSNSQISREVHGYHPHLIIYCYSRHTSESMWDTVRCLWLSKINGIPTSFLALYKLTTTWIRRSSEIKPLQTLIPNSPTLHLVTIQVHRASQCNVKHSISWWMKMWELSGGHCLSIHPSHILPSFIFCSTIYPFTFADFSFYRLHLLSSFFFCSEPMSYLSCLAGSD